MRRLLADVGSPQTRPTPLLGDNQGALALAQNSQFHELTKHVDVQHRYALECNGISIVTEYVPTAAMAADCLTKPLNGPMVANQRALLGIQDMTPPKGSVRIGDAYS